MVKGVEKMGKVDGMLVVTPSGRKIGIVLKTYRRNGVDYLIVRSDKGKIIKIDTRLVEKEEGRIVYLDPLEVLLGALTRIGKLASKILSGIREVS